jgi:hypothetical protein
MEQEQDFVPPLVGAGQAALSGALTPAAGPDAGPARRTVPPAFAGLRWRVVPDRTPARGHDAKP